MPFDALAPPCLGPNVAQRVIESWVSGFDRACGCRVILTGVPSSLDFGIESFQFHAGTSNTELLVDAPLLGVGFFLTKL